MMAHSHSSQFSLSCVRSSQHVRVRSSCRRPLHLIAAGGVLAVFCASVSMAASAFTAAPSIIGRDLVGSHRLGARGTSAWTSADSSGMSFGLAAGKALRNEASLAALSGVSWMPSMPQTCEDDFECNGGKANFPLQCLDVLVAKICVDPDDFQQSSQTSPELAYVPLPVRADDSRWPQDQRS
jgi:hypothetical protein